VPPQSRTASKIHLKALLKSLNEFFTNIRKIKEEEKRLKRNFYSSMKEEVEHIINHYLLNQEKMDEETKKNLEEMQKMWLDIEKEIMGVVIIVTRDPVYFWKKSKMWRRSRNVVLAEDIEEAVEFCLKTKTFDTNPFGKPVNAIILDPSVVEKLDDLQRLKEIMEKEKIIGDIRVE